MIRTFSFAVALTTGLSACASFDDPLEGAVAPPATRDYNVVGFNVDVPATLVVSEANAYYPGADIVWRGDPPGNRYDQIEAIFDDAMGRGFRQVDGNRDVNVDIEVTRFHALTERARYSIGGIHSISFLVTVSDAASGDVIEGPREVQADLEAFGGQQAIEAEFRGETQKVRISDHLTNVSRGLFPDTPAG